MYIKNSIIFIFILKNMLLFLQIFSQGFTEKKTKTYFADLHTTQNIL